MKRLLPILLAALVAAFLVPAVAQTPVPHSCLILDDYNTCYKIPPPWTGEPQECKTGEIPVYGTCEELCQQMPQYCPKYRWPYDYGFCRDGGLCFPVPSPFGTIEGCAQLSTLPCATPTPAPELPSVLPVPIFMPGFEHPVFYYWGSVIHEGGWYTMWITLNDSIWRFYSSDGRVWTGYGRVLAATESWEDDGLGIDPFEGFQHGISSPSVLRLPSGYVMAYMGGMIPNTETRGGIGLAYSADGIRWQKDPRNPILRNPGGGIYALSMLVIRGEVYFYFSTTPSSGTGENFRVKLGANGKPLLYESTQRLPYGGAVYPLGCESCGCWMAELLDFGVAGAGTFTISRCADCFANSNGHQVARVDLSFSGRAANWGPFVADRGPTGEIVSSTPLILYATGDSWASWELQGISLQKLQVRRHLERRK